MMEQVICKIAQTDLVPKTERSLHVEEQFQIIIVSLGGGHLGESMSYDTTCAIPAKLDPG
jgi:hypothetical protein